MTKRFLDIFLSLPALLISTPILFAVAIAVRLMLGGPVLFTQTRTGRGGKLFKIYKFRSMTSEVGADGMLLPDSVRLTSFGKMLRATSLDELPELWNILRGDMSLVGPRPLLPEYLPHYSERQQKRHDVLPGLTGWAQVNGRNALSWEERFEMDVWYVENQNFLLDLKILVMTVTTVLSRSGVSAEKHATMPPFAGLEHLKEPAPDLAS